MKQGTIFLISVLCFVWLVGCPSPDVPPPPQFPAGFSIETTFIRLSGPIFSAPFVSTHWDYIQDVQGGNTPVGSTSSFDRTTNSAGVGVSENGRVPALWNVTWNTARPDPNCAGKMTGAQSNPQRTTEILCFQVPFPAGSDNLAVGGEFTFAPRPLYTDNSSGNRATITGQGFTPQYGMPLLRYFDSTGNLVNQATASVVASDGTWITAAIPDLLQVQPGSYVGVVYNANSSGVYTLLGTTSVTVLDPPIIPSGGGCRGTPRPLNCN